MIESSIINLKKSYWSSSSKEFCGDNQTLCVNCLISLGLKIGDNCGKLVLKTKTNKQWQNQTSTKTKHSNQNKLEFRLTA